MVENFKSLHIQSEIEIIEKKSKFIGHAMPVSSENEALEYIEGIKKKHYNASHNVFAYTIGHNDYCRYSDDGEPSGTAGMPILNILKSENIRNALIVVTRYFGGTLLGTGGLLRAYQSAAKSALNSAVIIEKSLYKKISLSCNYNISGKIKYYILENENIILDTLYTDSVEYTVLSKYSEHRNFLEGIRDISADSIKPELLDELYVSKINNEINIFKKESF